jgi:D-serine deaminase-like pyridoxal phosphate-dependent protein
MTTFAPPLATAELDTYRIQDTSRVLTPALAIYPDVVDSNIAATIRLLGGDANRWRAHVKTAKLAFTMARTVAHGVLNYKCATTLELSAACESGARDVLVAYPLVGAAARRVRELAERYSGVRISTLVENAHQAEAWAGTRVGLFIDVNPGMDRTGIPQERIGEILGVVRAIQALGIEFRGLHYYDGHLALPDLAEREAATHRGYDKLMAVVEAVIASGAGVEEVITSGTPEFPFAATYPRFRGGPFVHRASPGTVVYCDVSTFESLPEQYGYRPAVVVLSTVVSHPIANYATCDGGHKAVSADAGVPTCAVLGRPDLLPLKPSEEHLPIEALDGAPLPEIGETLYLVPRHVCPTVNNFDEALIVRDHKIVGVERVTARGHESPLAAAAGAVHS